MSETHIPLTQVADDPLPELVPWIESLRSRGSAPGSERFWPGSVGLPHEALPSLIRVLDDEDPKVREPRRGEAVGGLGPESLPCSRVYSRSDDSTFDAKRCRHRQFGPLAKPAIEDLHRSKNSDPRTASGAARRWVTSAPATETVAPLAEAMRGTNIVLCRLAAKALSQIGTAALSTLISHLQHTDPFVKGESALAIGWMGPAPGRRCRSSAASCAARVAL